MSFRTLNLSAPFLKTFKLACALCERGTVKADMPTVLINAPALEHIITCDFVPHVYDLKDISSLVKAEVSFPGTAYNVSPYPDEYLGSWAFKLLHDISNVKSLSISPPTMKTLLDADDTWSLPTFRNLTTLKFPKSSSFTASLNWNWVISFFKSCPIFRQLILQGCVFCHDGSQSNRYNEVPACFISHLKTVKVSEYMGKYEVEDMRYFLKNANVLEKMILEISQGFGNMTTEEVIETSEKILSLPRTSPTCQIEIRHN